MVKALISDCEGPISKNDNAFEITSHFVPEGDRLFAVISRYDDVLAEVLRRPGHKAGDTLKLILPFLKAYGVTDLEMRKFSVQSLKLIPNIKDALRYVRSVAEAFIISTSYEHYVEALCSALNFPNRNAYCTKLSVDKYKITEAEKRRLKGLASEISRMPIVEIPPKASSLNDFPEEYVEVIARLDEIFLEEVANMSAGRMLREISPVGGFEKAEAVKDIVKRLKIDISDVIYVGDSITDVEAFKLVKDGGGLTVSFNGNQYAIRNSEVAVLSESGVVMALIADLFVKFGKQVTMNVIEGWSLKALENRVSPALLKKLLELRPEELPKVKIVTSEDIDALIEESYEFRKTVRGEAIGRLG